MRAVDEAMRMPGPGRITDIAFSYRAAKVLLSAVELGLFTALTEGSIDLEAARRKVGIARRGARDFFDALVALGLLQRDERGRYGNTPETAQYLDCRSSTYIGAELDFMNARQFGPWGRLTEALRTGTPQSGARVTRAYDAYYADRATLQNVAEGMTAGSLLPAKALAARFPWRDYRTLVDIGTAQGCLPAQIALAHPHMTGCGLDLPPLQPVFEQYVGNLGLGDRLTFHPGDFFRDPFPRADILVMGRVLHNWDLETKRMLLAKARDALPAGGVLIVYERLIDNERCKNADALLASLNMLVITAGGFDFTAADCIAWMQEAGFRDQRVEPLAAGQSMIIAAK